MRKAYYVKSLKVSQLWAHKNIDLKLTPDVNILIGPNGSGKTTILNLLRHITSLDLSALDQIDFAKASIRLHPFEGASGKTLSVQRTDDTTVVRFGDKRLELQLPPEDPPTRRAVYHRMRTMHKLARKIRDDLDFHVPFVWLPVSRRLPIPEEEEDEFEAVQWQKRRSQVESVDERLRQLEQELSRYRLALDAKLTERYKGFERSALESILYSEDVDRQIEFSTERTPTDEDKKQLLRAFDNVGLLDNRVRGRIEKHFVAAADALAKVTSGEDIQLKDVLIIPLIHRTRSLVSFARELEEDRAKIFAPLRRFEEILGGFFEDKTAQVTDAGELIVRIESRPDSHLAVDHLSSGEKQILIMFIQALLHEDRPAVYVADEPELSLHVLWQEKLLKSLITLGGQLQIIVATHSPDIVGPYRDSVIELGM